MGPTSHTVLTTVLALDGIAVSSHREKHLPELRRLGSDVSAVVSFARGKTVCSTTLSHPIVASSDYIDDSVPNENIIDPSGGRDAARDNSVVKNRSRNYVATWGHEREAVAQGNEVTLQTKLQKRGGTYENKPVEVTIGLVRQGETVVLGFATLNITGNMPTTQFDLPIEPVAVNVEDAEYAVGKQRNRFGKKANRNISRNISLGPVTFCSDRKRMYGLHTNAAIRLRVSVVLTKEHKVRMKEAANYTEQVLMAELNHQDQPVIVKNTSGASSVSSVTTADFSNDENSRFISKPSKERDGGPSRNISREKKSKNRTYMYQKSEGGKDETMLQDFPRQVPTCIHLSSQPQTMQPTKIKSPLPPEQILQCATQPSVLIFSESLRECQRRSKHSDSYPPKVTAKADQNIYRNRVPGYSIFQCEDLITNIESDTGPPKIIDLSINRVESEELSAIGKQETNNGLLNCGGTGSGGQHQFLRREEFVGCTNYEGQESRMAHLIESARLSRSRVNGGHTGGLNSSERSHSPIMHHSQRAVADQSRNNSLIDCEILTKESGKEHETRIGAKNIHDLITNGAEDGEKKRINGDTFGEDENSSFGTIEEFNFNLRASSSASPSSRATGLYSV